MNSGDPNFTPNLCLVARTIDALRNESKHNTINLVVQTRSLNMWENSSYERNEGRVFTEHLEKIYGFLLEAVIYNLNP